MPGRFDKNIQSVGADLRLSYRLLLSGKPGDLDDAQELIAAYREAGADFASLDLLVRVKAWIANARTTKRRAFLAKIHQDALNLINSDGSWRTLANCGRAFRYTGRFYKAQKAYDAAFTIIDRIISPTDQDKQDIADVYADYAEFRSYLGHPGEADGHLLRIPDGFLKGWHQWVRALAYHFWAFEEVKPFASPNVDNKPGPEGKYLQSNGYLADARNDPNLPPQEAADTFLLEAANWGAIWRRRITEGGDINQAQQMAAAALANFRGGDAVNTEWTWVKERRGRLGSFFRKKLDGNLYGQGVWDWRTKFRAHYRENLLQAGLPEDSSSTDPDLKDGELDDVDDHSGDDQD
jgi:tetratricopeptide (TPR) repeat protein